MPEAGQRIGEYVLESRIGDGAFGEVWRGRHHVWADQMVAVKIPRDPAFLHNLRREGTFVHGLTHPCIVRAINFDPFADPPYLVMEYVPGTNLRPLIGGQRLPVADVVAILGQVLAALEHAHGRGMVHRDIKPENILIHEHCQSQGYGSAGLVKVADFGLGKSVQAASESMQYSQSIAQGHKIVGTLEYMSPEQRAGQESDPRDDLYAVGMIACELLTGSRPAGAGVGPLFARAGVNGPLREVCEKALEERHYRHATAKELGEALRSAIVDPPANIRPAPLPLPKAPRRESAPAIVVPEAGRILTLVLGKGVSMNLSLIPAGMFLMGSPQNEEGRFDDETQHEVTVTRPFYMGVTPVTQAQYEAVMGNKPSYFKGKAGWVGRLFGSPDDSRAADHPVEGVSWHDAAKFCRKLSQSSGRMARLPTEAEWEYACRAGAGGPYAGTGKLDEMGWYGANSGGKTHPVGEKKANAWGLYDMHGNVWEWCADWIGEYPAGAVKDPVGPRNGTARLLRGGSWGDPPRYCRSAGRGRGVPAPGGNDDGFRVAMDFQ